MVADLVRPGSKRKLQESDVSFTSETTAVMEEEDLITFDYQHYDADSPSTKSVNGSGMNLVNLQFNTLNVIGKIWNAIHIDLKKFSLCPLSAPKGFLCLPAVCKYFKQQRLNIIMIDVNSVICRFEDFQFKDSNQHLESNRDYILISVYCSTEFWSLSSDKLSGYIKAQAFSILVSLFFQLRLNSSGLRLLIFHKMN